jgi:hypothetical protein
VAAVEHAGHVHLYRALLIREGDRVQAAGLQDAGVVDQQVQAPAGLGSERRERGIPIGL